MNTRVGLGLCVAFVLGVVAGYVGRGSSGGTREGPRPTLRISSIATSDAGHCDQLEKTVTERVEVSMPGMEGPAAAFTASLALPDSDAKLASVKRAFAQ